MMGRGVSGIIAAGSGRAWLPSVGAKAQPAVAKQNGDMDMPTRFKHAAGTLIAATALAWSAFAQAAAEPRYTYVEGGYTNVDYDDIDVDGDGFALGGSYALHRNVHLLADYQDVDLDGNADANALALGVGANFPLRQGLDLVTRLRWINQEIEVGNQSNDEDGYGFEAGLRAMINPQLELDGSIRYVDIDDEDDTSIVIGGLYELTSNFALGGDIELSDDYTAIFLKARYYVSAPWPLR